jgi:response regulator RpfG family c-di-GMP phosphodiesterase
VCARIFSLVHVYDALTTDHPYRAAWTKEKALEYINSQAGIQFDPVLVKVFMKMMNVDRKTI